MPDTETIEDNLEPDAFDLAFEAAAGQDLPDLPPEPETPPTPEPTPEAPPEPQPEPQPETPPEPAPPAPEPPAPTPPATPEPTAPTPPPAPEPPPAPTTVDDSFTEDEQAAFDEVAANFTEVSAAIKATQRVMLAKMENMVEKRVADVLARLAPVAAVAQNVAYTKFKDEVHKVHADAEKLLPEVEAWILTQPDFLQESYNNVLDRGTVAQTIKLYNVFKKETGSAQPPPPPEPPKDPEKEKRLNAQEGVRGRHTGGRAAVDPNDFDGAFEKFAATA